MMKIFSVDKNIPLLAKSLEYNGYKVYEFVGTDLTNQELIRTETEFLILRSTTKVNANLLKNTNVKFVATATSGIDHIDLEYLNNAKIRFFAALGSNSNSVAEYVIYAILRWIQHLEFASGNVKVGIIGYGNIGKKVESYLASMHIKSAINDPPLAKLNSHKDNFFCELDEILETCNVITLHIPLQKMGIYKTLNLLDVNFINKIKANSLLINAARGGIVDEIALIRRKDLYFVIDTWQNEPNCNISLANSAMLATPHIAGHSHEGKLNATAMIINELNSYYHLDLSLKFIVSEHNSDIFLDKKYMENFDIILSNLEKYRKISVDSLVFKKNFAQKTEKQADFFRNFREQYPIRHEILFLAGQNFFDFAL